MKNNYQINRGQTISFRIPSDTPEYVLKELQRLKKEERRNFSSKMAEFVLKGVNEASSVQQETVTVPLPKRLTKAQRNWIKHEHSEALLGSILYHLLNDPRRATSLLTSLNSNATDIDEALYLQEDMPTEPDDLEQAVNAEANDQKQDSLDEFDTIDWNKALDQNRQSNQEKESEAEEEEGLGDLLGDFLTKMNK
ncbi:hypothetical protein MUN88_07305 [Gracilibacillus caseinilyticus]|uniref:Plasmid segregation centromere-binding protein ParR n=1 Tax=Gracilibacillus caseinilyticus TaxID=2932256 RepID=A0ABY4F128_9BACI|nr:hypothetical protein [Gracilibacillus caseinilyticus]UOQ49872.1 hypothetical protein MUN88_07305 [Gracilibacillus caseinilyticus]